MQEALTFGRFRLLPAARILYCGDQRLKVGSRALEILLALAERAGDLVSKQELAARVWPGLHVDDGALRVHVSALRKVLGDDPAAPQFIFNVAGQGYRFVAPTTVPTAQEQSTTDEARATVSRAAVRAIGRELAIRRVIASLQQSRFVTITGPGGIGKTTVAMAVAEQLASGYSHGKTFVDLTSLSDPELLPSTLASALRLPVSTDDPTGELIAWLRTQKMLLMLDSCEHLIDAVADLGEKIISAAADVHLLTTSREPLRAAGEWVTRLPPLELPSRLDGAGLREALESPAILLFVERARAADDTFALSGDNVADIIDICHRLDGIPLAIEFAAARVGAFGAKELLTRLDDRFALLRSGRRTAVPRHRTLRATLDWSHELLPPREQVLFRRLAAFRGSFTLDAVQMTASAPGEQAEVLLDGIANLVAKSLLNTNSEDGEVRYSLLETTRAYAAEKLLQSHEAARLARLLAEYLDQLFDTAERDWANMPTPQWSRRYELVIGDVRAALDWAFSEEGDTALGAALTASSSPLWFSLGLLAEYRVRAERALRLVEVGRIIAPRAEMRLNILVASARFHTDGPLTERLKSYARALEIASSLDDGEYQLRALWGLAAHRFSQGNYDEGLEFCERLDAVAETSNDRAAKIVRDRIMALGLHLVGRQTEARPYAERALGGSAALMRSTHKSFHEYDNQVAARSHLARILWIQGFPDQAAAVAREGVDRALTLNYPPPLYYIITFAACPIAFWTGDVTAARGYADLMRDPAVSRFFKYWQPWHLIYDVVAGLESELSSDQLSEALGRLGDVAGHPARSNLLATLRPELARPDAFARATEGSAGWPAPEILRAQSIAVLRQGRDHSVAEATVLLQRSLELSRRQGAHSWELRSAITLARLYHRSCDAEAARETLRPVYARFTEGFATSDLRTAAALLEELEA